MKKATQSGAELKTYEPFIFGIFQLIFSARGKPQITETVVTESADTWVPLYMTTCVLHVFFRGQDRNKSSTR